MTQGLRHKLCSSDAAAALVPDGGFVYLSGNAATPHGLANALAARTDLTKTVRVGHVLMLGQDPFAAAQPGRFRHLAWFVGPADRSAVASGDADYCPVHLHQIPRLLRDGPTLDVAMLMVSPPDRHGYMSLGVEVMASLAAVRNARRVVVQINEAMPRVHGDSFIHLDQVTAAIHLDQPLPELAPPPATAEQDSIAQHVMRLIPDGATLQLGIGGVPDAVLRLLHGRSDLGVHSEMVGDGVVDAVEAGLITGRSKTLHPGKVVITFAMGTRRLYDFVADNPMFEARPCDYVNDPRVIAKNRHMVAINQALSVDLSGQVCSDSIGHRIWSGFGGQVDFMRGAAMAQGGVPIVALPSTAKGGTVSRIVPSLQEGSGVVTSRADVHWVVTEYGAVDLFGRTLRQRSQLLASIAHPDFRDGLMEAAAGLHR